MFVFLPTLCTVLAELELNRQCTLPSASPQLLPYLHPQKKMVHMEDISNDGWAAGCFLHEMITCVIPDWGETFFPVDAIVQAQQLPEDERMAAYVPAMQREHRKLVSCRFSCVDHMHCLQA